MSFYFFLIFVELPKAECSSDQECANNKACINQICSDPCQLATTSVCAYNAECRVQMHRPICVCREGLTGNAQNQCFDSECNDDLHEIFSLNTR